MLFKVVLLEHLKVSEPLQIIYIERIILDKLTGRLREESLKNQWQVVEEIISQELVCHLMRALRERRSEARLKLVLLCLWLTPTLRE
jgi:hypothetical protein